MTKWLIRPAGSQRKAAAVCAVEDSLLFFLRHKRRTRLSPITYRKLLHGSHRLATRDKKNDRGQAIARAVRASVELWKVLVFPRPLAGDQREQLERRRRVTAAWRTRRHAFGRRVAERQLTPRQLAAKARLALRDGRGGKFPSDQWIEVRATEVTGLEEKYPGQIALQHLRDGSLWAMRLP